MYSSQYEKRLELFSRELKIGCASSSMLSKLGELVVALDRDTWDAVNRVVNMILRHTDGVKRLTLDAGHETWVRDQSYSGGLGIAVHDILLATSIQTVSRLTHLTLREIPLKGSQARLNHDLHFQHLTDVRLWDCPTPPS
jgi:hypothetical protein